MTEYGDIFAPYPKINTLYKRTDKGVIIPSQFARPEFEYLYDNDWIWTEKVDGTNIRIGWAPESHVGYGIQHIFGRTNRAQIPSDLLNRLQDIYSDISNNGLWEQVFDGDAYVTLYGEGYGNRIQNGGVYLKNYVDFVLFDVKVGDWWLDYEDVEDVAFHLGLDVVPRVLTGTIAEAEAFVLEDKSYSQWGGHFVPEGLVGRPKTTLFNKAGDRILCKIKHVDYDRLNQQERES